VPNPMLELRIVIGRDVSLATASSFYGTNAARSGRPCREST
jgi:hypothetical protein